LAGDDTNGQERRGCCAKEPAPQAMRLLFQGVVIFADRSVKSTGTLLSSDWKTFAGSHFGIDARDVTLYRSRQKTPMMRQGLSLTLAGLILFNFGSPLSLLARAGESRPAVPSGDLSLASDPLGAGVYVDGVFAGQTPVMLSVPAGEHRVRLVKDGYLENSRVVSVDEGRATSVQVKLTRQVGSQAARLEQVQVAVGPAQGGGGSKLPWLLVGLGGGFAGGYLYQKSKSSDAPSTPANRAPTAGAVAISPSIGLMSATSISFSVASAADADGDALTFAWTFGDGSTSTSASPTHTYSTAGTFTVTVSVGDGKGGTVSTSGQVTIKSLAGTWTGPLIGNQTYNTILVMVQSGASVTNASTYSDQFQNAGTLTGAVTATAPIVTLSVTVGTNTPFTFTGTPTLTAGTDTLTGTANGSGFTNASWVLTR